MVKKLKGKLSVRKDRLGEEKKTFLMAIYLRVFVVIVQTGTG